MASHERPKVREVIHPMDHLRARLYPGDVIFRSNRFAPLSTLALAFVAMAWPVRAEAPPDLYQSALNRIESVYLWRDTLAISEVLDALAAQILSLIHI